MSSLDVILAGYSAGINDEDKLNDPLFKKGYEIATHDKPIFKRTPPAVGTGKPDADVIAGPEYKKVLTRPRTIPEEIEYQERSDKAVNDLLKIETQGELFPNEIPNLPVAPDTRLGDFQEQGGWLDEKPLRDMNPRRKGGYVPKRTRRSEQNKRRNAQEEAKRKALEDWRRENGLDPDGNAFPPWWNNLQINPDVIKGILQLIPALAGFDLQMAGGPMLPGERGSTPGGLGNMNKDALERWIKENGMGGGAANKIREKWERLHRDINLPLAHNYRPGPTGGSLYNTLMIRANELMNEGEKDKALELLKISPELYRLEKV